METTKSLTDLACIRTYLLRNGWREGAVFSTGTMFVFSEPDDDGLEITVFVPLSTTYEDYPRGVSDVIDTVSAVERRSKDAVRADLLAMNTTPAASPNGTTASVPDAATQPQA